MLAMQRALWTLILLFYSLFAHWSTVPKRILIHYNISRTNEIVLTVYLIDWIKLYNYAKHFVELSQSYWVLAFATIMSQYVHFVPLFKSPNRKLIPYQIDEEFILMTAILTSISRTNDKIVDVSVYQYIVWKSNLCATFSSYHPASIL